MLDVVEGNDSGSFVLLNHGNAFFNAPIAYAFTETMTGPEAPTNSHPLALADMNGDGRPDLLSLGSCCQLGVFLNHGDGTFASAVTFATAPQPFWIATGDLNGDHQDDVAVVSSNGADISRLRVLINASH
jgi:hypothetical protein